MRLIAFVFFLSASLASVAPVAQAAPDWLRPDAAYSATRVIKAGGHEISGPVYYDGGKERFEMAMEGTQQILIRREDKQRLYMIMPQMGMGMEMRLDNPQGGNQAMPNAGDYAALEPEAVGHETVNGEAATKYRVVAKDAGRSYTVFIWASDDGIPLRIEGDSAEGTFIVELSGLKRGAQPAALFEVPAGIQLMAMPGQ